MKSEEKNKLLNSIPLTRDSVEWGYRLFLDREPEHVKVVDEKLKSCLSIRELRQEFLNSDEFKKNNPSIYKPSLNGDEPKMYVEHSCSEHDLQRIFDHIQNSWQYLGETEPYWSVLTSDKFLQSNIEQHKDTFYESGKQDVENLFKTLERNGVNYSSYRKCLEYGCGLGRVTRWLSERFESVIGYDISLSHLEKAGEYLSHKSIYNVDLRHIKNLVDIINLPKVDVVYSLIVLQHNPPPIISLIIEEFIKALNPGGIAYFQVPTYHFGYNFSVEKYLQNEIANPAMEIHVLPQSRIFAIAKQLGGQCIEVIEDSKGKTGLNNSEVSNTFLIQFNNS